MRVVGEEAQEVNEQSPDVNLILPDTSRLRGGGGGGGAGEGATEIAAQLEPPRKKS